VSEYRYRITRMDRDGEQETLAEGKFSAPPWREQDKVRIYVDRVQVQLAVEYPLVPEV
jgi:hypothetical protein